MKICFVCNEYPPDPHGGVGTFVKTIAGELSRIGVEVVVAGMYKSVNSLTKSSQEGVKLIKFPMAKGTNNFSSFLYNHFLFAGYLEKLIRTEHIDLVEAPEGGGWTAFLKKSCKHIIRLHNLAPFIAVQEKRRRGRLIETFENLAIRRADHLIAVSQFIANQVPDLYPYSNASNKKINVIYNGINTSIFTPVPYKERTPFKILFAGTLKPSKGVDYLIDAFLKLVRRQRDATLVLCGKDTIINRTSYLESILSNVPAHALSKISHLNHVPFEIMPKIYGSSTLCVFPSLAESFGLVAAEAMSCARPVINSNRTASAEIIIHGKTGYLCDPTDTTLLATLIEYVLCNESEAEAVGKRASFEVKERFSLEECVNKTLALYNSIL